jgi:hypothetical protein
VTPTEAEELVSRLTAAFIASWPLERTELWTDELAALEHAPAVEACREVIRTADRVPSLRQYLDAYRAAARRITEPPQLTRLAELREPTYTADQIIAKWEAEGTHPTQLATLKKYRAARQAAAETRRPNP